MGLTDHLPLAMYECIAQLKYLHSSFVSAMVSVMVYQLLEECTIIGRLIQLLMIDF